MGVEALGGEVKGGREGEEESGGELREGVWGVEWGERGEVERGR